MKRSVLWKLSVRTQRTPGQTAESRRNCQTNDSGSAEATNKRMAPAKTNRETRSSRRNLGGDRYIEAQMLVFTAVMPGAAQQRPGHPVSDREDG